MDLLKLFIAGLIILGILILGGVVVLAIVGFLTISFVQWLEANPLLKAGVGPSWSYLDNSSVHSLI